VHLPGVPGEVRVVLLHQVLDDAGAARITDLSQAAHRVRCFGFRLTGRQVAHARSSQGVPSLEEWARPWQRPRRAFPKKVVPAAFLSDPDNPYHGHGEAAPHERETR